MTIPTTAKQLADYLQTDAYNLRQRLQEANGQIHFDPDTDELTPDQLAVWLPRYLEGRGQFKGEKRQLVMDLIGQLNANGNNETNQSNTNGTPTQRQRNNGTPTEPNQRNTNGTKPTKTTKTTKTIKPTERQNNGKGIVMALSLTAAVSAVLWQASHFAHLEAMDNPFNGIWKSVVAWGIAIGFESLALLLTVFSDKESRATWGWLIGFAVVAVFMNLSFYGVIEAVQFRKVVLSIALPFSIVATTHLFISTKSK